MLGFINKNLNLLRFYNLFIRLYLRKSEIKHIMIGDIYENRDINYFGQETSYKKSVYEEGIFVKVDMNTKEIKNEKLKKKSENNTDTLKKFEEKVKHYHIARWKELPDFELYMDQILGFLEKHTEIFGTSDGEKLITNSMINNYVKLGLIKAPVKKRYNRNHVASLIMITILKKVLSMNEIKEAIFHCSNKMGEEASYNLFCEELEMSMVESLQELSEEVPAFKVATKALSSKVIAEKIIEENSKIYINKKI